MRASDSPGRAKEANRAHDAWHRRVLKAATTPLLRRRHHALDIAAGTKFTVRDADASSTVGSASIFSTATMTHDTGGFFTLILRTKEFMASVAGQLAGYGVPAEPPRLRVLRPVGGRWCSPRPRRRRSSPPPCTLHTPVTVPPARAHTFVLIIKRARAAAPLAEPAERVARAPSPPPPPPRTGPSASEARRRRFERGGCRRVLDPRIADWIFAAAPPGGRLRAGSAGAAGPPAAAAGRARADSSRGRRPRARRARAPRRWRRRAAAAFGETFCGEALPSSFTSRRLRGSPSRRGRAA